MKVFVSFTAAAAASRVYVDALSRLARQAQLGTWGGSKDVGELQKNRSNFDAWIIRDESE